MIKITLQHRNGSDGTFVSTKDTLEEALIEIADRCEEEDDTGYFFEVSEESPVKSCTGANLGYTLVDSLTTDEMKEEAIRRLKALDIHQNVLDDFRQGVINVSYYGLGMLYWADEEEQKMVAKFEAENEAIVYHVIKDYTDIGTLYSLMFVSNYKEEWTYELTAASAFVYVINEASPWCSEFGTIGIEPMFGGVARTY